VTIQLGSSLLPANTGGLALGQGGCNVFGPIVTYVDATSPALNATLLSQPAWVASIPANRLAMAVGATQVVLLVGGNESALVSVYSPDLSMLIAAPFTMASIGGGCNGTSGGGADASAQVLWDGPAQRWLLLEPTADLLHLCLYVSVGADATGPYQVQTYTLDADDGYDTSHPQLALWGNTYAITLAQCRLCVANRSAILAGATDSGYFCAGALNGLLPAFVLNAWTPLHADGNAPPSSAVETAGAMASAVAGAVFMRAIDDELQYGASTSTVDQLEVEHWYGINFTTATFNALRYKVAVAEFDQSYALCPSIDICIPTPSVYELDPVREPLMPRLVYRSTPNSALVATLTSHANGLDIARFYWFELRFATPYWQLYQQGISPSADGLHKWLPSASLDAYGNLVIGYVAANVTVWPSLYASMRLASDSPLGALRNTTLLLKAGDTPSHLTSTEWGPASATVADPSVGRTWYFSGQHGAASPQPWAVQTSQLLMAEQLVTRNYTAQDYCGSAAWCLQEIVGE
jgi:hypothetical protein